jgi:hypothetical protein
MSNIVIPLEGKTNKWSPVDPLKPLQGHGKLITRVAIRPPTFDEYLEYGEPFMVAPSPNANVPYILYDNAIIAAYTRAMVIEPEDALIITQGGFQLARAIRMAILSFFGFGAVADAATTTSGTS